MHGAQIGSHIVFESEPRRPRPHPGLAVRAAQAPATHLDTNARMKVLAGIGQESSVSVHEEARLRANTIGAHSWPRIVAKRESVHMALAYTRRWTLLRPSSNARDLGVVEPA